MNHEQDTSAAPADSRRGALKSMAAGVIGAAVGIIPLIPGVAFFLDPLLRRGKSGESSAGTGKKDSEGYIRMAVGFAALPEDGTPQQFTVYDDKTDAWNRFTDVPVGSIWLRRVGNNVIAFNTVCPHLGCAVEHRRAEGDFFCPCHTSAFDLDGSKMNEVPPRDMDALDVRRKRGGVEASDGDEIWVRFENYRAATSEKIPV